MVEEEKWSVMDLKLLLERGRGALMPARWTCRDFDEDGRFPSFAQEVFGLLGPGLLGMDAREWKRDASLEIAEARLEGTEDPCVRLRGVKSNGQWRVVCEVKPRFWDIKRPRKRRRFERPVEMRGATFRALVNEVSGENGCVMIPFDSTTLRKLWLSKKRWSSGAIHGQAARRQADLPLRDATVQKALEPLKRVLPGHVINLPCFIFTAPGLPLERQHFHRDLMPDEGEGEAVLLAAFNPNTYIWLCPGSHTVKIDPGDGSIRKYGEKHAVRVDIPSGFALVCDPHLVHAGAGGDCAPRFHAYLFRPPIDTGVYPLRSRSKNGPLARTLPPIGQQY